MILGDIIARNERLHAHDAALVFEDRRFSHRDYAERCRRLANALAGAGVRYQDRVAVLCRNRNEILEVYGACEIAGYIAVPLNFRLAASEIAFLVGDCQPTVLLFESDYAEVVRGVRGGPTTVTTWVSIGGAVEGAADYESFLGEASPETPQTSADESSIAYLIYTSGTTGRPKGVMLSHRGQINTARVVSDESGFEPTDKMLLVMPLYHVGGKCMQLGHFWKGAALVLHSAFHPEEFLATVEREKITTTLLAPTMIRSLLDSPSFGRHDLSSLRRIIYSAAPMPVALLRRAISAFGNIFVQYYGMTESGPIGTALLASHHVLDGPPHLTRRLAAAGQPSLTCEIRTVGEDGADCAPEQPGEVLIRSPSNMEGYWNNFAASNEVLRGGWVHTGDVGILDADGFLYIVDRKKDMIVSGGENIYPREIEEVLHRCPLVSEAAVIGIPDETWGETVAAFVVVMPGERPSADTIDAYCLEHLARYKRPRRIEFLEALPKLANGKIDKKVLREPFWRGRERKI